MKLYMKSLMLLLFLGTVASCNDSFLDQTQTSDLNRETVFADSTYQGKRTSANCLIINSSLLFSKLI